MAFAMNIAMTVFATLSFVFGISYYIREKEIGNMRYYILLMGLAAGFGNMGYMLMSVTPLSPLTIIFRDMGMCGVNIYLIGELLMVLNQTSHSRRFVRLVTFVMCSINLVMMILHGMPGDVTFIQDGIFTSFINNHLIGYKLQSYVAIIDFIILFSLAIHWYREQTAKRGKTFVFLCIASNFFYLFSSFPYFFGKHTAHPAFLYCLGLFTAFFVIWYAGILFSGFNVTAQSLSGDLFRKLSCGLMALDPNGRLMLRNEYSRTQMGVSVVHAQKINYIFDITDREAEEIIETVNEKGMDVRTLKLPNDNRVFSVNFNLKKDFFGDPLCILMVVNDITRQEEMIKQVSAANRAKSDFLALMSHEIRTPINAVLGMNEMIKRESKEENIVNYSQDVESSGKMLLSLINDILDFSKVESGKMEITLVEYDLSSVVNDVNNMIKSRAVEKGLEFKIDVDSNIPNTLFGDEIRIRQVITNLLSNAVKYTPSGLVNLKLAAEPVDSRPYSAFKKEDELNLCIRVIDTGKGIKEEDMPVLFDSFTRVDEVNNRTIEGTGLGLALTKRFVELMGGNISVDSTYGEGSTFTVVIPQKVVNPAPIGDFQSKIEKSQKEKKNKKLNVKDCHVLVVDDVEMNCKVFCHLLKNTGLLIDIAYSGEQALELCKKNKYDIIYMDHRMPVMDGIQCLHLLKEMDTPNNDTPVIALTANAISGMKEMYISEGFDGFMSKPVVAKELEKSVIKFAGDKVCNYD